MKYILRNSIRRPKDTSPHVSLFPFLAVLICTMGALVPLLFTISRQARLQAEQAAAKDEEIKADVKSEREMVQWRIEQLQLSRKKTESDIERARLELGHLEDHSRRLKAKAAELEKTIGEIDRADDGGGPRRAATAADLEDLRKQVAEAERQLAVAKLKAEGKKRSYAIVPYEGPNSTHRRPIYLECRDEAVVLQPEGIAFYVHDFEGPMGPSNPLAAALRTVREYLLSQKGFDPQRDGEPYPLLLVRPDGIVAYYAARAAMKSWGPEFGYEFVEADWKLAYQPPDPQLALAVNEAAASARAIQQRLIAAAPRQYSQRIPSSASSGASSRGGGKYGSGTGSVSDGMGGGLSRGSGGSQRTGGDFGSSESHGGGGIGFGGAGGGGKDDFDSWDHDRTVPGAPDPFLAGVNNPYASLAVGGAGTGGAKHEPRPMVAALQGAGTGGAGVGGAGVGGAKHEPRPMVAALQGTGVGGTKHEPRPMVAALQSDEANPACQAVPGPGMTKNNKNLSTEAETSNPMRPGIGSNAAGPMTTSPSTAGAGQGGAAGQSQRTSEPPDIFAGRVAASNAARNATENRAGANSSDATRGQAVPPLRPGEWHERPKPPPESMVPEKFKDQVKKKDNAAKHRAPDWGLQDAPRGSVPITRPVVVECRADRLLLQPEQGRGGNPLAVMALGAESTIDELISAIWDRMSQWGMAGRGMYWRPVLHVRVAPGGEQRFADLQALLEGSGLDVIRR
ncbi:MAG: hypothetical protein IT426_17945 [Pirellulales bacterium]|nr:hypothetical protein [Pirellulales bacterium]